ncbi:gas vesicle protein GvpG [Stackebrandtia nassauensis]|uniref:Gas vesicle G n=1 Tax=Stackebrandtia nassauensis (strain DSM 44728 / CIP 108903 / NRRL B-16338 / NBRC 102104 / LLR-40K-21) TaxID=446470 RepID=D3Q7K5_STANL|nr:gas vesicle protein GvpG [Stackebrandtia nassauensis]ADD44347.1 Gas vesicle G [Stackebrandtia nassauensis DSM 44728]
MFGLLLAPVLGVVRLAELIHREAERQYRDPAAVMGALEAVDAARRNGELSETEAEQAERELLARLYPPRPAGSLLPPSHER